MELMRALIVLTHIIPLSAIYVEIQRHFDFEDVLTKDQNEFWVWRSEASKLKTLRLVDPDSVYHVEIDICTEPVKGADHVTIQLDDIRYANDGPFDAIIVTFNGEPWATYKTFEKWAWGHDWNIFRNTGRLGDAYVLPKGNYTIGISVITDKWGIELDKIRLNAEYHDIDTRLFCGGRLVTP